VEVKQQKIQKQKQIRAAAQPHNVTEQSYLSAFNRGIFSGQHKDAESPLLRE
jgi:hypothetical protein